VELRPTLLLLLGLTPATLALLPRAGPLAAPPAALAIGLLAGLLPALAVPRWLGRRLGGHSGDSYGACVEWSESLALLLSALVLTLAG
jgi:adenosylcobinamide-GDP ribazoletransferase